MDSDFIQKIKDKARLYDVVSKKVRLQRSGRDWLGLCPFHKEKSPSFRVMDSGSFHCYGCGEHGDVISFVQKIENLTFKDAIGYLAEMYNIPLPTTAIHEENPSKIVYNALEKINLWFVRQLHDTSVGSVARDYLISRNITDASIEKFQLGFCPNNDTLLKYLQKEGLSEELLIRTGVFARNKYHNKLTNRYNGRLMFPIFDVYGRCVGFGGRIMDHLQAVKYINSPETEVFSKHDLLYGYSIARRSKSRQIVVVEGYLDVITMHQAGFDGTVAPLGTAINKSQIDLCWRVCDYPIISLDGDNAGIMAAYRWIDRIFESLVPGKSFKFALLPQGTDPDILISSGQRSLMENVLNSAIPLSQWLWTGAFSLYPSETPEQKAVIIKKLLQKTELIQDASIRRFYVQEIKAKEKEYVSARFKTVSKKKRDFKKVVPVVSSREKFEKIFLVTVLNHPYILDVVIEDFVKIEMKISQTRSLQRRIIECYNIAGTDRELYVQKMQQLRHEFEQMEKDVVLHAKFAMESSSDEVAIAGWNDALNSFLAQPGLAQDLQTAVSSLQSSFSEDDWQRLKALKQEDIKGKWKI